MSKTKPPNLPSLQYDASNLERAFKRYLAALYKKKTRYSGPAVLEHRYRAEMMALLERLRAIGLTVPDLGKLDDEGFAANGYYYLFEVRRLISQDTLQKAITLSKPAAQRSLAVDEIADLEKRLSAE